MTDTTSIELEQAPRYHAHPLDGLGVVEGPAIALKAQCDEDALREALAELGPGFEVWIDARRLRSCLVEV